MSANMRVDEAIEALGSGQRFRCNDLGKMLEGLGFEIRDAKKIGHKVVTHPGLTNFHSASYTCGHGKDDEIKPQYIKKIRTVIDDYRDDLIDFLL